jgi:hypothetical protein
MQASKKIPFEDPTTLNLVRAGYVLSNIIIAGIYLYMQQKINAKKGIYPAYLHFSSVICQYSLRIYSPKLDASALPSRDFHLHHPLTPFS